MPGSGLSGVSGSSRRTGDRKAPPSSTGPHAGLHPAPRGLAGVRLQTPRPRRSRAPLAPHGGPREILRLCPRPDPRRRPPLGRGELGGAKKGGPWWDWSETKIAAERLLDTGELVCRQRKGFERVYDLAERAVPPHLFGAELDDAACHLRLVRAAAAALGVATTADLAAYHGLTRARVDAMIGEAGLVPVRVAGWDRPAFTSEAALALLERRMKGRSVLVSPFDSLTWYRERTERVFAFRHRLEAYVPRAKRTHGYFSMPVLGGHRFVGLVDPGRSGRTLVAKHVSLETRCGRPRGRSARAGRRLGRLRRRRRRAGDTARTAAELDGLVAAAVRG